MQVTFDESRTTCDRGASLAFPGLMLLIFGFSAAMHAQSFPSGSTGADGDLIISTPGVTTFTARPVGGGIVYNFNTIQIAAGSTLKLSGAVFASPLYFLAQGPVSVAGTIDLSGQNGSVPSTSAQRIPSVPGPGGYAGGSASFGGITQMPGLGPSGGSGWEGGPPGNAGYCGTGSVPGGFSGNQYLVPLVGGSGASGWTASGGAGGGALLIASSSSIIITGTITANGGNGVSGSGGGAGGGIRLVAPTMAGTGSITATGGAAGWAAGCVYSGPKNNAGGSGVVRLESSQYAFTGMTGGNLYLATPFNLFVPSATAQPSIVVTSIGGVAVPPSPTGSFTVPDVVLNSSSPLTVNIKASNIPLGTIPTIYFSTENFPDQQIVASAGLAGTLAASTTTAKVTLNPGYSVGYIVATWTQ